MRERLNQAGDTLVEVLLAIAVLSSIIGISYATSGRAQRAAQLSQQRSEATGLAQTQAERLRAMRSAGFSGPRAAIDFRSFITTRTSGFAGTPKQFCITTVTVPPDASNFQDSGPAAGCKMGTNNFFDVAVTWDAANNNYAIVVTWLASGSGQQQNVTMRYRVW